MKKIGYSSQVRIPQHHKNSHKSITHLESAQTAKLNAKHNKRKHSSSQVTADLSTLNFLNDARLIIKEREWGVGGGRGILSGRKVRGAHENNTASAMIAGLISQVIVRGGCGGTGPEKISNYRDGGAWPPRGHPCNPVLSSPRIFRPVYGRVGDLIDAATQSWVPTNRLHSVTRLYVKPFALLFFFPLCTRGCTRKRGTIPCSDEALSLVIMKPPQLDFFDTTQLYLM